MLITTGYPKRKQFPSLQAAEEELKTKGKLTYFGRSGESYEWCIYNLQIGTVIYHIHINNDGLMIIEGYRYDYS